MIIDRLLIDLHYFSCLEYFIYLLNSKEVQLEYCEHYQKQSYRNRCIIKGANKVEVLSVPVRNDKSSKHIRDIEIDYSQSWQNNHLRAIQSAYGKAPFFLYYMDDFKRVLQKKVKYLADLNESLLTICLKCLNSTDISIVKTTTFDKEVNKGVIDARGMIHPKKEPFRLLNIHEVEYFQVFGRNFEWNLSILDLIFCEGPMAKQILSKSIPNV